jgi:hypothetical protein
MDTTLLDELARVECVKGQTGKGKRGLTAVSARREAIADSLAECPPGGWIATEEFFRYMQATLDVRAAACRNPDLRVMAFPVPSPPRQFEPAGSHKLW